MRSEQESSEDSSLSLEEIDVCCGMEADVARVSHARKSDRNWDAWAEQDSSEDSTLSLEIDVSTDGPWSI